MSSSRRVVLSARRDLFAVPGGDSIQVTETAAALRTLGIDVDIQLERLRLRRGDIVHLFNITRIHDTLARSREARAACVPTVVTPIHHALEWVDYYERTVREGLPGFVSRMATRDVREVLKASARALRRPNQIGDVLSMARRGYTAAQLEVLNASKAVICNSDLELRTLRQELGYEGPGVISYLGLSTAFRQALQDDGGPPLGIPDEPFILSVGRIEPRKNQLSVVAIAQELRLGLVLIGVPSRLSSDYATRVMNEGSRLPWFKHMPWVSQDEIVTWYRHARCHVLASWFETIGLVTLEAAACSCPVVSTSRSYISEYLDDRCICADPSLMRQLSNAVETALSRSPVDLATLAARAQSFTWGEGASVMARVYEDIWASHA